jgi:hypothetical protein
MNQKPKILQSELGRIRRAMSTAENAISEYLWLSLMNVQNPMARHKLADAFRYSSHNLFGRISEAIGECEIVP